MIEAVELRYSRTEVCKFIKLSEFLRLCGVYVHERRGAVREWKKNRQIVKDRPILFVLSCEDEPEVLGELLQEQEPEVWMGICDGEKDSDFSKRSLEAFLEKLFLENDTSDFIRELYRKYEASELYRYLYLARTIKEAGFLVQESRNRIWNFREEILSMGKEARQSGVFYFASAYLGYWIDALDARNKEEMSIDRRELLACVTEASKRYPMACTLSELRGDILFLCEDGYLFGLLHYKTAMQFSSYSAAEKLAEYWRNINPDPDNEEKYLRYALSLNEELLGVRDYLGRRYEEQKQTENAIQLYESILGTLKEKETYNFLQAEEYYYVCQAHKRIGCMLYKNERQPQYASAVSEYKKIFRLWNQCRENSFFQCFPEEYRGELELYYRKRFNINAVLASLRKIYQLMGDDQKSKKCAELFLKKTKDLIELPLDEL